VRKRSNAGSGNGPDRSQALAQYRRRAAVYDMELALFEPIRCRAISRLALQHGDVVVDVGCGTGLSFSLLRDAVGPGGRVIGIEQSPEMIDHARARLEHGHWDQVTLQCSPVETARIPVRADAALFHFTHDILRRPEAVANVMRHLKPGARVVASGLKWSEPWAGPVNLFVWLAAQYSTTTLQGLEAPWRVLETHLRSVEMETLWAGSVYIASGRALGQG
jgi:ubiquinone/menaquinone biosynthesis C-methylase UbiE